jgi:hypothetical protein
MLNIWYSPETPFILTHNSLSRFFPCVLGGIPSSYSHQSSGWIRPRIIS